MVKPRKYYIDGLGERSSLSRGCTHEKVKVKDQSRSCNLDVLDWSASDTIDDVFAVMLGSRLVNFSMGRR